MVAFPNSFWPDDLVPKARVYPPLAILQQVAGQLPQKSDNLFEAKISTEEEQEPNEEIWLTHTLYIVVPALSRYSRPLLNVSHEVNDVYPAHLFDYDGSRVPCNSQEELMTAIQNVLRSPRVRAIFYSLAAKLAQSPVAT